MAPTTIRKAIGVVKDQTSISIAKVAGNIAPDLEVLVVKATTHDELPTDEKYYREIISLTSTYSHGDSYVHACVLAVSKRLSKTRDWIVALKCFMLIHRLLLDGDKSFEEDFRNGMRSLNMSHFRDEAHSNSWDHSLFVRVYALFLDEKVEVGVFERKYLKGSEKNETLRENDGRFGERGYRDEFEGSGRRYDDGGDYKDRRRDDFEYGIGRRYDDGGDYKDRRRDDFEHGIGRRYDDGGDYKDRRRDEFEHGIGRRYDDGGDYKARREEKRVFTPVREMGSERLLGKLNNLLRVLDRVLACKPVGFAKTSRLVLVSVYQVLKESFVLYAEICEVLEVLLDKFLEMEYVDCVKCFNMYVSAAKIIDELNGFYNWCKDVGIARSSEYPEVQRISDKTLETLEGFLKEMDSGSASKSPKRKEEKVVIEEKPKEMDMNEIKALPPPENYTPPPPPAPEPQPNKPEPQKATEDLVNLRDDGVSADEQGNKLALALFSGPPKKQTNGEWEAFSTNGEPEVTSAWQNPAAETGKPDWELALVETASNLSNQKATMSGGFDPLILNGMYDQGAVRQHVSTTQSSGGSASSVALPSQNKIATQVLALPAPDGTVQPVGNQDPFAASLSVPPPSYVQIADMEMKQHLLVHEQQVWQQYGSNGMQGQLGLAKVNGSTSYYGTAPSQQVMMPYQPGGYYYPTY